MFLREIRIILYNKESFKLFTGLSTEQNALI